MLMFSAYGRYVSRERFECLRLCFRVELEVGRGRPISRFVQTLQSCGDLAFRAAQLEGFAHG